MAKKKLHPIARVELEVMKHKLEGERDELRENAAHAVKNHNMLDAMGFQLCADGLDLAIERISLRLGYPPRPKEDLRCA